MFEQLQNDDFDQMYRQQAVGHVHGHTTMGLASLHLSASVVEKMGDITLTDFRGKRTAVIAFREHDSFVLSTTYATQSADFLVEVSGVIDVATQIRILDYVLKGFDLTLADCLWLNPSLSFLKDDSLTSDLLDSVRTCSRFGEPNAEG